MIIAGLQETGGRPVGTRVHPVLNLFKAAQGDFIDYDDKRRRRAGHHDHHCMMGNQMMHRTVYE